MADSLLVEGCGGRGGPTQPTFIAPSPANCQGVFDRIMLYQSSTDSIYEHSAQSRTPPLEYRLDMRRLPKRLTASDRDHPPAYFRHLSCRLFRIQLERNGAFFPRCKLNSLEAAESADGNVGV